MAPLADTMRLVNRDESHRRQPAAKRGLEAGRGSQLWRQVDQAGTRNLLAATRVPASACASAAWRPAQHGQHGLALGGQPLGVQGLGGHAQGAELPDLIVHESDQRRDHHAKRRGVAQERGELEAQRLAAACREDEQRIPAGREGLDDGPLATAEAREAVNPLQARQQRVAARSRAPPSAGHRGLGGSKAWKGRRLGGRVRPLSHRHRRDHSRLLAC
mmetsp:Transcript_85792/g.276929  ORF Transcript_85792/g.276929 Transcript_85792/m.276929 type:complete len:217 (-) Transcript_85792:601-1251(-)